MSATFDRAPGIQHKLRVRPRRALEPPATVSVIIPCFDYVRFLPSAVLSALTQEGVDVDVVYDEWAAQTALRYLVPPDEVAGSVVYLASDLARPVTGQAIYTGAGQWFH